MFFTLQHYSSLLIGLAALVVSVFGCSRGRSDPPEIEKRGELTIEYYKPQAGIAHGDGKPGGCSFTFRGERYSTPPMVKNGGRMFRCDVKPDSDEPVIRIAYYRPEDDWTCGTRFGLEKAKCLPDQYEPIGGMLTVRNGELAFEEHGFWDTSYEWGEHSVRFGDGREFDYKEWKWSGCGDKPRSYVKSGSLTVANGRSCKEGEWHRVYVGGKEIVADGSDGHPFDSVGINQDATVPSTTAWIGNVKGFIYISKGKAVFKEVPEAPEFVQDGKAAKWWSADYQTRYTMDLATEKTITEARPEVQKILEKTGAERELEEQAAPLLTSDDFAKFESDYRGRHGQFYLGDLKKFDELKDTGWYPYSGKKLVASAAGDSVYYLFMTRSVTQTPTASAPCIGSFITSVIWLELDADMIPRDARSQVVSSCLLGRKQIGEPQIENGSVNIVFEDASGRHELIYNNNEPGSGFLVK